MCKCVRPSVLDHGVRRGSRSRRRRIDPAYSGNSRERHASVARLAHRVRSRFDRVVIATGGSIVSEPGTYDFLLSTCFTVWLKAQPEEHMARVVAQGDTRPMAGNAQAMEDLRRILQGRGMLYAQADAVVDTAGHTVEQSLRALKKSLPSAA